MGGKPRRAAPEGDGRRILALAAAALGVEPREPGALDGGALNAARAALAAWCAETGAPAIELRRAGRRLAVLEETLADATEFDAALAGAPRAAAWAAVDVVAKSDRDFAWDVPLRDVARAAFEAALRAAR